MKTGLEQTQEILARYGEGRHEIVGTCAYLQCGKPVGRREGRTFVGSRVFHTDCYWNEFGDEVEKHPICSPRRKGIGGIMLDDFDLELVDVNLFIRN